MFAQVQVNENFIITGEKEESYALERTRADIGSKTKFSIGLLL
jgi:hypothetical protein